LKHFLFTMKFKFYLFSIFHHKAIQILTHFFQHSNRYLDFKINQIIGDWRILPSLVCRTIECLFYKINLLVKLLKCSILLLCNIWFCLNFWNCNGLLQIVLCSKLIGILPTIRINRRADVFTSKLIGHFNAEIWIGQRGSNLNCYNYWSNFSTGHLTQMSFMYHVLLTTHK
jgi:hypothetical protein